MILRRLEVGLVYLEEADLLKMGRKDEAGRRFCLGASLRLLALLFQAWRGWTSRTPKGTSNSQLLFLYWK
jgi:hypothetical protein